MELSKVLDCISHKLLLGKVNMYGFSENALKFFFSYLERQRYSVQINKTWSYFNYSYLMFRQTQSSARFSLIYS